LRIERSCQNHLDQHYVKKKKKSKKKPMRPGVVVHSYNPSTWEAEAEGLRVQGQLGLYNDFKVFSAM
jgi:hypothetical protein